MTELSYVDVRPVLAKIADLERDLVLVGGQAVNFWASYYERRVAELASEAPFTSNDIDFCGDQRAVRMCAERLNSLAKRIDEVWAELEVLVCNGAYEEAVIRARTAHEEGVVRPGKRKPRCKSGQPEFLRRRLRNLRPRFLRQRLRNVDRVREVK